MGLHKIVQGGLDPRLSGTNAGAMFGHGVYFAEDIGKTDQYSRADRTWDNALVMHNRLYGKTYLSPAPTHRCGAPISHGSGFASRVRVRSRVRCLRRWGEQGTC